MALTRSGLLLNDVVPVWIIHLAAAVNLTPVNDTQTQHSAHNDWNHVPRVTSNFEFSFHLNPDLGVILTCCHWCLSFHWCCYLLDTKQQFDFAHRYKTMNAGLLTININICTRMYIMWTADCTQVCVCSRTHRCQCWVGRTPVCLHYICLLCNPMLWKLC